MKKNRFFKPLAQIMVAVLGLLVLSMPTLWAQDAPSTTNSNPSTVQAAPDLVVTGINFLPPNPGAGKIADITPIIKNQGDANAATLKIKLYVEPAQDPPTTTTPTAGETVFGLGLAAGATFDGWTRTQYPFTQDNPQVCAWVDPDNQVAESDETNNIFCIKIPTLPEPPPDPFEQDDDCATAKAITPNGAAQDRNLAHEGGQPD